MMKKATPEEALAVTTVFWDIKMCPVPPGFDACLVGPCIRRLLEKYGYYGPLTINAVGKLTDVPIDILRGVFSSGVALTIVPYGSASIPSLINGITPPPPANFLIISDPSACPDLSLVLQMFQYNALHFPYDSIQSLIMVDSAAHVEEYAGESPLWDCLVCARDPPGQCFENFTTHLFSQEHQELLLEQSTGNVVSFIPPNLTNMDKVDQRWMNIPPIPIFESPRDINGMSAGETFVFWDINKCPVPSGYDARLVGPGIRLFFKNTDCFGPLTIIAIGVLTEVSDDILSAVYSSGIFLHNVPYGSSDISDFIDKCSQRIGPLGNVMVISNAKIFACHAILEWRCNLLEPFPVDLGLFLADSGALEEDKCSEMGEIAFCVCSLCDPTHTFHSFIRFSEHLSSRVHLEKLSNLLPMSIELRRMNAPISEPHEIDLGAVTLVVWDIKMCPVPHGCDPRLVRPCIKQFLENKGYYGPLIITAIGALTGFPEDILRGVCSSGIALHNVAYGFSEAEDLFDDFADKNPPPANIMVISQGKISPLCVWLQASGYNFLEYDSLESLNLTDSGALEEEKSGESASWVCSSCYPNVSGQGFANFTSHMASIPHQRKLLDWFPREYSQATKLQEVKKQKIGTELSHDVLNPTHEEVEEE